MKLLLPSRSIGAITPMENVPVRIEKPPKNYLPDNAKRGWTTAKCVWLIVSLNASSIGNSSYNVTAEYPSCFARWDTNSAAVLLIPFDFHNAHCARQPFIASILYDDALSIGLWRPSTAISHVSPLWASSRRVTMMSKHLCFFKETWENNLISILSTLRSLSYLYASACAMISRNVSSTRGMKQLMDSYNTLHSQRML